jgi:nucleotide-binding universal stress UspA family protein
MRSILAVSDLTPGSDRALTTAAGIAVRKGAELHIMHSMDIVGMPLWEAVQTDVGRRIRDAESALAEQVRRAVPAHCAIASCALDFQQLEDSVLLRTRAVGADLLVMGAPEPPPQTRAGHLRAIHAVVGLAAVPCLLVRNPLGHTLARVLVPLSVAELTQGVLADACGWLTSFHAPAPAGAPMTELQVLHVASGARGWHNLVPELDREVRRLSEQRQWSARLQISRCILWNGAPHTEILRAAVTGAPDLVLLGADCGGASSPDPQRTRTLLLRHLPCSVLVLPGSAQSDGEGGGSATHFRPREVADFDSAEPADALLIATGGERHVLP